MPPVLNSASGPLIHGQIVKLAGSGMGSVVAPPVKFETLEGGKFLPGWESTSTLKIGNVAAEQRWPGAKYNIAANVTNATRDCKFIDSNGTLSARWFIQFWIKFAPDFTWGTGNYGQPGNTFLSNVKLIRLWNPGNTSENYAVTFGGYESGGQLYVFAENTGERTRYAMSNFIQKISAAKPESDGWHLFQFQFKENSGLGVADGGSTLWIDGAKVFEDYGMVTRKNFAGLKRPRIIGIEDEWGNAGGAGDNAPNRFWMDDIVSDTKWTRFEISNNPVYEAGMREFQPLVLVTDGVSEFRFNQGQLKDGEKVYGWFTNEQGERNAVGLPLTVGHGTVTVPASTPAPTPVPTTGKIILKIPAQTKTLEPGKNYTVRIEIVQG